MSVESGQPILAQDIIKSTPWYAADAGSNDTYAISLPVAPSAYADGETFRFKANTANTGASSLNVNTLGAIAIKRPDGTDTQTGDIVANQIVEVVYRGGSFYMTSPTIADRQNVMGPMQAGLVKLYYTMHLLFTLWTGAVSSDTSTTFGNWNRTDATKVVIPPLGAFASFESTGDAFLSTNTAPFFPSAGGVELSFAESNIVIMDFWAKYISGTGEALWGLSGGNNDSFKDVYGTNMSIVAFHIANGVLYAMSSKADPSGTEQRTNISSGVTLTNWNNYRIEFDMGADIIKYYVNGVLKHTESTVFPVTSEIYVGFGRGTTNPVQFGVTAPFISLEMNP